ncbi:pectinesterase/pectinesterase inhibitor PPE8B-like [Pyrus x bretschneideri]|uniref:pectinesterase/pectinesterase inhibitor PPE8B-like n=1 Tax=Pyrus x bretschneideri TaxID=225117 RepID=UPI0020304BA2|nr:pectinesterase/pectinesterase inhibitor PPE8B-like [Pyrus x bretschneideri]
MEAFDGTRYSMIAQSFKQVSSSTQDLLKMLQAKPGRIEATAGLDFWKTPNVTVSQDGSGNFRTITEALAVAPSHSQNYFVIFVKRGVYKENVNIDGSKCNLVLIGEGMDVTTISGSRSFRGGWETFYSATFAVSADGFIAMDIGFENTAGPENYQAVALLSGGDRAVFYRCKISGYQDTLLVHAGRQFFRECQISGSLDFIFGYGAAVFQKCLITVKKTIPAVINTVTAHGRYAPNDPTGFSFQFCTISADSDVAAGYLGRPWGKYSRTVFMQSYISNVIQPQGWIEWKGKSALDTLYYGEYTNNGPGAGLSSRVNWPGYHVIENPGEADEFTTAKFIEGDSWLTPTNIPFIRGLED